MSSYAAAIDHLNALAPELFTQPGRPRRKFSIDEIRTLLAALGNPHHTFPSVLIAGTNGKGSTAATLASILQAAGLRTGLYTSPHLERPNERIRIHSPYAPHAISEISDEDFARHFFAVRAAAAKLVASGALEQSPSFFEILTAMAFLAFAEAQIDIAVLEVGLGGRLDATNVVHPTVSVITDIALDHTEWLGPTITAIAREKAGILRPNGVLVTLPQHPEANQAIGEIATELGVRAISAAPYMPPLHTPGGQPYTVEVLGKEIEIDSPLHGAHQHRNIALAIATAVELHSQPVPHPSASFADGWETKAAHITPQSIADGIRETRWPGRLETLTTPGTPVPTYWILDVAHNPAGVWALRSGLNNMLSSPAATELGAPGPSHLGTGESTTNPSGGADLAAPQVPELAAPQMPQFFSPAATDPGAPGPSHLGTGAPTNRSGEAELAAPQVPELAAPQVPQLFSPPATELGAPGPSHLGTGVSTNPSGEAELAAPQVLVFGCLRDKPLLEMAQILFPLFRQVIFAPIASPRAAANDDLLRAAATTGTPALAAPSLETALETAREFSAGCPIVISGSVYLVGAARAALRRLGATT